MSRLITHSRLATRRRCQREERYRYAEGLTTPSSDALRFGSLVHLGLEAWWSDKGLAGAIEAMRASAAADALHDLARAEAMLIGYDARWTADARGYEVLGVEAEFRAPLPWPPVLDPDAPWAATPGPDLRGWQLAGKLDAIVRERASRRVLIVEHKTTSEDAAPGGAYWARLRLDGQVSLYHLGARALGHDVAGVLYDVLVKPAVKPQLATPAGQQKWTLGKTVACPNHRGAHPPSCMCGGTGRIESEPPRLYAGQRLVDESPEDYRARLVAEIAASPGRYYHRGEVVRLERERARHDRDLLGQARDIVMGGSVPNPEACTRFSATCPFLPLCTGERQSEEYVRLTWPHPELTEDKA